jgi:hypothetical protein
MEKLINEAVLLQALHGFDAALLVGLPRVDLTVAPEASKSQQE